MDSCVLCWMRHRFGVILLECRRRDVVVVVVDFIYNNELSIDAEACHLPPRRPWEAGMQAGFVCIRCALVSASNSAHRLI